MEELRRKQTINEHDVYVTKLYGEGEQGQYHVVVAHNGTSEYHTGYRELCEKFIKDTVTRGKLTAGE